jgi:hypothetical protein
MGWLVIGGIVAAGCTTVDPGPNFVVPNQVFNADYFYCHVEPQVIFANGCGDKQAGACHFSSSVPQMQLIQHAPIDCGGGEHPVDPTTVGQGSFAYANYTAASFEMNRDYTSASFYLYPTQQENHPLRIFPGDPNDPNVTIIATWAQK